MDINSQIAGRVRKTIAVVRPVPAGIASARHGVRLPPKIGSMRPTSPDEGQAGRDRAARGGAGRSHEGRRGGLT